MADKEPRSASIAAVLAVGAGVLLALKPVLFLMIGVVLVAAWLVRHPLMLLAVLLDFSIGGS